MCGMEYRLKKGSVYEGKVEKVDFPNKATVWVTDEDGQKEKAIVKNAIPGQTVRFCVNKKRKGHCEGRLMEVVEKSPLETSPACPHFGKCGGCTYQTVAYEEQLKIKSAQVEKLLSEVVSGELPFEGIIGSPVTEEYRNKMEFSFGDEYKDGPLALGLHKRNSMYDIVPVTECKIIDEDYRKILTCVQDYAIEKELPFQHKLSHEGYLRHLLVRKSVKTGQILVDIVTTTQIEHDFTELLNRLTLIDELPKTIIYPLDGTKIETWAILAAGFCGGGVKGKVQLGAPWWFNDQAFGISRQFEACANLYPVSLSVGMLTDSRSFISYPRHELYRRVFCDYLGKLAERGEYFAGEKALQKIIEDVCFNNVNEYFGFDVKYEG